VNGLAGVAEVLVHGVGGVLGDLVLGDEHVVVQLGLFHLALGHQEHDGDVVVEVDIVVVLVEDLLEGEVEVVGHGLLGGVRREGVVLSRVEVVVDGPDGVEERVVVLGHILAANIPPTLTIHSLLFILSFSSNPALESGCPFGTTSMFFCLFVFLGIVVMKPY